MEVKQWTTFEHKLASSNLTNDIIARLTGRTPNAVLSYRARNGLDSDPNRWTEKEDLLLRYYPILSIKDIGMVLPNRNKDHIADRMLVLGLIEREDNLSEWTSEDTELLSGLTTEAQGNRSVLRLLFRRARTSVLDQMERMGLKKPDLRKHPPTYIRARILRGVLARKSLEQMWIETTEIRSYVVTSIAKEYSKQLGIPVKGLK